MLQTVRSDPRYSRKTKAQLVEELKRLERQVCDSSPPAAEHTKSAAKLRENEQLFKVIFNGTIDSIFVIDPNGERIVDANASACRMLQYSRKDLLKLSISDIHPHEMEKVRQLAQEVFSRGKAQSDQLSCLTKSGGHIPVEVTASRVNMQGRPYMLVVARDITERREAERELEQKSAVLQVILDTMDQGISVVDANLNSIGSNAKFLELLEFPPELGPGTPFEAYIRYNAERGEYGTGNIEKLVKERVELAKQFKPHRFERVRPDGTVIEIRGNPSADGGFVTTYTDITERKRAEVQQNGRNRVLEKLATGASLEDVLSAVVTTTQEMRPGMLCSILLLDRDANRLRHGAAPSLPAFYNEAIDGLEIGAEVGSCGAAAHTGKRVIVEDVMVHPYWVEFRELAEEAGLRACWSEPIASSTNEILGTFAIYYREPRAPDQSDFEIIKSAAHLAGIAIERKRAEAALRDAIESIADGFVLFDANDRVVMWNQRFADLYPELAHMLPERPTAEEMFRERIRVGAVGTFDVPVDDYVRWRMEMRRKQGGSPAVHRGSEGRWFRTTERKTSEGGIVAISTDITELKNQEARLREAKEQAEFANRSKSEFLANMSHELRTPLNAINGFSEMMRLQMFGPLGDARYLAYAEDIFNSGNDLLDLINDILDLSKIEAGKFALYEEPLDVAKMIESCLRIVKERAKENGLHLTTRLAKDLPKLKADERALKQITLNLLSNAIKFTPHGGRITVRARLDRDGCFVLAVADTGIGIAAKEVETAFAPFGQVDVVLNHAHRGTGLGLPLVKSLVELHGGTLDLKSKVGVGTTVTACFPAERVLQTPYEPDVEVSAAQR